jgi:imidazolonepropionase-like amidohydrolase
MKFKVLILFLSVISIAKAQNPAPAQNQKQAIALIGGTIHVGNGKIIENGVIVFDNGIIKSIGEMNSPIPTNVEIIDVKGKSIYPGIIAPNAQVGLQEIGALRPTNDIAELGNMNPNVRALIAYNTDSEIIPTIRGNGVLIGQATPDGGIISGTSAIMEYDGWNWEDAVVKKDDGVWLSWPSYFSRSFDFEDFKVKTKKNDKKADELRELIQFFNEAKAYATLDKPDNINLKFEAMKGLFNASKTLFVRADYGKEIFEAIKFSKELGINKIVIVGAEQAELVLDLLKTNKIPVLVSPTHRLPTMPDDDVWKPYKLPATLMKAGILVGIYYTDEFYKTRNLPFIAGTAAGFGMTSEEALEMVTLNNAKILGIDKQVGSLEIGKHATLVVSKGDVLDMKSNTIELAFIRGKKIDLDDKQKRLNKKFSDKFGIK